MDTPFLPIRRTNAPRPASNPFKTQSKPRWRRLPRALAALAALALTAACSAPSYLVVQPTPADAQIRVTELPSNRPVVAERDATNGFRFPVSFDTENPQLRYRVDVAAIGNEAEDYEPAQTELSAEAFAQLTALAAPSADGFNVAEALGTGPVTRLLPMPLRERAKPEPVVMSFEFQNVRERLEDSQVVYDEWGRMEDGIRTALTDRYGRRTPAYVDRFLDALANAGRAEQVRDSATMSGGVEIKLYTYRFDVEFEDIGDVGTLSREIAELGRTGSADPENGVPEFKPLNATIAYATSYVESRLTVTIEGIAPRGAGVYIYDHGADTPRRIDRPLDATLWRTGFNVAAGHRYVYGYSEIISTPSATRSAATPSLADALLDPSAGPVRPDSDQPDAALGTAIAEAADTGEATVLRKAFRIDIFGGGRQLEIPFARLDTLRTTEP